MQTITVYREDWEAKFKVWEIDEEESKNYADIKKVTLPDRNVRDLLMWSEKFYKKRLNDILEANK